MMSWAFSGYSIGINLVTVIKKKDINFLFLMKLTHI